MHYDPMIAKLIAWDTTREAALVRMREALAACAVVGPKSNVEFLERLVRHPAIVEGRIDTGYLDRHLDEFLAPRAEAGEDPLALFAATTAWLLHEEAAAPRLARASGDPFSPWAQADGWRLGHRGKRIVALLDRGTRVEVGAHGAAGRYRLDAGSTHAEVERATLHEGVLSAAVDGITRRWRVVLDDERVTVHDGDRRRSFTHAPAFAYAAAGEASGDRVVAPMPGRIVVVKAKPGEDVAEGQELLVMEAMKMELSLKAPRAGRVEAVQAAAGDFVEADAVLVRLAQAG